MSGGLLFPVTAVILFCLGVWGMVAPGAPLRRLIAFNIAGSGTFLFLVALAARPGASPPDPVPHALVLTGIVVAVSATALGLILTLRAERPEAPPTEEDHGRP